MTTKLDMAREAAQEARRVRQVNASSHEYNGGLYRVTPYGLGSGLPDAWKLELESIEPGYQRVPRSGERYLPGTWYFATEAQAIAAIPRHRSWWQLAPGKKS